MKLRDWIWVSFVAGPRLTWWMALVYYAAPVLFLAAVVVGVLLLLPKTFLQAIRGLVFGGP